MTEWNERHFRSSSSKPRFIRLTHGLLFQSHTKTSIHQTCLFISPWRQAARYYSMHLFITVIILLYWTSISQKNPNQLNQSPWMSTNEKRHLALSSGRSLTKTTIQRACAYPVYFLLRRTLPLYYSNHSSWMNTKWMNEWMKRHLDALPNHDSWQYSIHPSITVVTSLFFVSHRAISFYFLSDSWRVFPSFYRTPDTFTNFYQSSPIDHHELNSLHSTQWNEITSISISISIISSKS